MTTLQERAREVLVQCPEWYHSIELAPGAVTPGRAPLDVWKGTLDNLRLPDLHGKSVLDIGAHDGFFSFAAEKLVASRAVALNEHVWATDMVGYIKEWKGARALGAAVPAPRDSRHWQPQVLPGKEPFDAAHELLNSNVEAVVGNFMTMDLSSPGRFDVVFFLGILYHMEEPLPAMRRVASLFYPGGFLRIELRIETEAVEIPGAADAPFFEFFPTNELNNDSANWSVPDAQALQGLTVAVGLQKFQLCVGPAAPVASRVTHGEDCAHAFATELLRTRTRRVELIIAWRSLA
jgi:tRNA (mo5U34)-methyltransferase